MWNSKGIMLNINYKNFELTVNCRIIVKLLVSNSIIVEN